MNSLPLHPQTIFKGDNKMILERNKYQNINEFIVGSFKSYHSQMIYVRKRREVLVLKGCNDQGNSDSRVNNDHDHLIPKPLYYLVNSLCQSECGTVGIQNERQATYKCKRCGRCACKCEASIHCPLLQNLSSR